MMSELSDTACLYTSVKKEVLTSILELVKRDYETIYDLSQKCVKILKGQTLANATNNNTGTISSPSASSTPTQPSVPLFRLENVLMNLLKYDMLSVLERFNVLGLLYQLFFYPIEVKNGVVTEIDIIEEYTCLKVLMFIFDVYDGCTNSIEKVFIQKLLQYSDSNQNRRLLSQSPRALLAIINEDFQKDLIPPSRFLPAVTMKNSELYRSKFEKIQNLPLHRFKEIMSVNVCVFKALVKDDDDSTKSEVDGKADKDSKASKDKTAAAKGGQSPRVIEDSFLKKIISSKDRGMSQIVSEEETSLYRKLNDQGVVGSQFTTEKKYFRDIWITGNINTLLNTLMTFDDNDAYIIGNTTQQLQGQQELVVVASSNNDLNTSNHGTSDNGSNHSSPANSPGKSDKFKAERDKKGRTKKDSGGSITSPGNGSTSNANMPKSSVLGTDKMHVFEIYPVFNRHIPALIPLEDDEMTWIHQEDASCLLWDDILTKGKNAHKVLTLGEAIKNKGKGDSPPSKSDGNSTTSSSSKKGDSNSSNIKDKDGNSDSNGSSAADMQECLRLMATALETQSLNPPQQQKVVDEIRSNGKVFLSKCGVTSQIFPKLVENCPLVAIECLSHLLKANEGMSACSFSESLYQNIEMYIEIAHHPYALSSPSDFIYFLTSLLLYQKAKSICLLSSICVSLLIPSML
jgi:hypothetical protein